MANKVFFQDHLFEDLPVDKYDNPMVTVNVMPAELKSECVSVSLDKLFRLNTKKEWGRLISNITNKNVCIVDDVPIVNEEVKPYKEFYLKTYYFNLSKYCRTCYVDKL